MTGQPEGASAGSSAGSERNTALIVLAFAIALAIATSQIEYAFSSDPMGPRAVPYLIAAGLGICGLWYLLRPGAAEPWPQGHVLARSALLIAVSAVAIGLMDRVGFVGAATAMAGLTAWLFGARPAIAAAIGLVQAIFWFALFRYLLGTYLPAGSWLFPA